jgi:hypothetical protein
MTGLMYDRSASVIVPGEGMRLRSNVLSSFALWPRSPLWRQRLDFEQYDTLDEYFYVMIFNRSSGSKRLYHLGSLIQLCARSCNGSILCQYRIIWSLTTTRFTTLFAHLHEQSILSRK